MDRDLNFCTLHETSRAETPRPLVDGDVRMAPVHAYDDDDIIPNTELRSICAALDLDIALFRPGTLAGFANRIITVSV
jgi:hypothetical protein